MYWMTKNIKLLSAIAMLSAALALGCSGGGVPSSPDDGGGTTGGGDVPEIPTDPLSDPARFAPLNEYSPAADITSSLAPGTTENCTDTRATALRVFFGSILPGCPATIETGTTGIHWIHSGSGTDQVRFETYADGFAHADFVSLPGSSQVGSTSFDVMLTSDTSRWYPTYYGAYSLVRLTGTRTGSTLNGEVCVRTVASADWTGGDFQHPANAIAQLFYDVYYMAPYGQYKQHNSSQPSALRSLVNCSNAGNVADIGTIAVQRSLGHFTIDITGIQP